MPCTYSVLRTRETNDEATEVKLSQWPFVIRGDDRRPMSAEQIRQKEQREAQEANNKRNSVRKRSIFDLSKGVTVDGPMHSLIFVIFVTMKVLCEFLY
jgi:hypothetical protein